MSAARIVELGPDAAAAMAVLHRQCFADAWDEDAFCALLSAPRIAAYGIIGTPDLAALALWRCAADEAEVLTIAVTPQHRRRRLANRLLAAVSTAARGQGATCLFCEVAEDNVPARALYAQLDFVIVGRRPAYYGREDGQAIDALIVRRALA